MALCTLKPPTLSIFSSISPTIISTSYTGDPAPSIFDVRDYRSLASPFTLSSLLQTVIKSVVLTFSAPLNKTLMAYQDHVNSCTRAFEAGTLTANERDEMINSFEFSIDNSSDKVVKDSALNALKFLMQQCFLRFTERVVLVGFGGYSSISSSSSLHKPYKYSFLSKLVKDPCKSVVRKASR